MIDKAIIAVAALVAMSTCAHAYLDPGTGSLVLQMLVAGALTAAASISMFWGRVKAFFFRFSKSKDSKQADLDE